jgi:hypothetical protein
MISGKYSQKIVDRSVWFRTGSVECKYSPSPIGLVYGYESFANGARCKYPVVERQPSTMVSADSGSGSGSVSTAGSATGVGRSCSSTGSPQTLQMISRRVGMPIAAGRVVGTGSAETLSEACAVRRDVDRR